MGYRVRVVSEDHTAKKPPNWYLGDYHAENAKDFFIFCLNPIVNVVNRNFTGKFLMRLAVTLITARSDMWSSSAGRACSRLPWADSICERNVQIMVFFSHHFNETDLCLSQRLNIKTGLSKRVLFCPNTRTFTLEYLGTFLRQVGKKHNYLESYTWAKFFGKEFHVVIVDIQSVELPT